MQRVRDHYIKQCKMEIEKMETRFIKWLVVLLLTIALSAAGQNEKLKPNDARVCARWGWTGDVFERKVYCVEWVINDCSYRLHVDICKRGN